MRSANKVSLARSLHILGPILGRKMGVQVRIGGSRACTDGNVIHLPSLPIEDDEAAILGFGHLFHEANHVRETDFSVDRRSGFVGSLVGALEDIRIDGLGFQRYPGGVRDREQLIELLVRQEHAKSAKAGDPPATILETYVFWRLEHEQLGLAAASEIAQQSEALFRETFPEGVATKLDALMFTVADCHSTADIVDLAERIAGMLKDEAASPPPPANTEGDGKEEPSGGDAPGDTQGSVSNPITEAQAEVLRRTLEAGEQEHMQGIGELVGQALEQRARETRSEGIEMVQVTEDGTGAGDPLSHERFELHVKGTTNALRQRIAGLLQAESRSRQTHTMAGRKIDTKKLAGISIGDFRVFKKRIEGIKTETAVQIVVDRSGSMSGAPIVVAREACFATALAMQSVPGVSVAVSAFPGGGGTSVVRLSDFGHRVERQIAGFESLNAGGGTPMVEAMLWGAAQLLSQNKPRRLLLVLTDGGYDGPRGKSMVERLARNGVECAGVGIGCDVAHLFDLYRVIADVGELPQAMFEALFEALKRQRRH